MRQKMPATCYAPPPFHVCHAHNKFADKTFVALRKSAKFAKVFALETFPLYGMPHCRGAVCTNAHACVMHSRYASITTSISYEINGCRDGKLTRTTATRNCQVPSAVVANNHNMYPHPYIVYYNPHYTCTKG